MFPIRWTLIDSIFNVRSNVPPSHIQIRSNDTSIVPLSEWRFPIFLGFITHSCIIYNSKFLPLIHYIYNAIELDHSLMLMRIWVVDSGSSGAIQGIGNRCVFDSDVKDLKHMHGGNERRQSQEPCRGFLEEL